MTAVISCFFTFDSKSSNVDARKQIRMSVNIIHLAEVYE